MSTKVAEWEDRTIGLSDTHTHMRKMKKINCNGTPAELTTKWQLGASCVFYCYCSLVCFYFAAKALQQKQHDELNTDIPKIKDCSRHLSYRSTLTREYTDSIEPVLSCSFASRFLTKEAHDIALPRLSATASTLLRRRAATGLVGVH